MMGTMRVLLPLLLATTCLALRAIPAGVAWCPISGEPVIAAACCTQAPAADRCCAPDPEPRTECCLSLDDDPATELAPLPQAPDRVALGPVEPIDSIVRSSSETALHGARAPPDPLPDPHLRDRRGIQLLI